MKTVLDLTREQYALVQDSRSVLFDYCNIIKPKDLISENHSFGHGGSIRNLLVHIANCYQAWLGRALKCPFEKTPLEEIQTMANIQTLFEKADKRMEQFLDWIAYEDPGILEITRDGQPMHLTPLALFSHVITHEFHHKGQILSISRHLGYIPVDTDILR